MENRNNNLIEILRRFNRKERFFLVGEALGNKDFKLGNEFRDKLTNKLKINIPEDAFAAMDYHLDWIEVSLKLWNDEIKIGKKFENEINEYNKRQLNSNQEDIDFIIAFESENNYHILLIEAKAETGWTNSQMNSKVKRLRKIFGDDGNRFKTIIVHFIMTSPKFSEGLRIDTWPKWMKLNNEANWLNLPIKNDFYKITRCDADGKPSNKGSFCIIDEKPHNKQNHAK